MHSSGRLKRADLLDAPPYDLCEVFSGAAALSRGAAEVGLKSYQFDVRRDPKQNCHTVEGIMMVAEALCRTIPRKSLVVMEPVCGSWVFISLGTTLRHIVTHPKHGSPGCEICRIIGCSIPGVLYSDLYHILKIKTKA